MSPTNTAEKTWLVEYRKRPPTSERPLTWRDYRTMEVVAPTRHKALIAWRWRYGGTGRDVVSVRVGAARGPQWIAAMVRGQSAA